MGDRERSVKDEAYRLWEEAGRPSGRDEELWYEAERRIAEAEGTPGGKRAPGTVVKNVGNSGVAAPVSIEKPKSGSASNSAKGKAPKPARAADSAPTEKAAKPKAGKPKSKAP